MRNWEHVKILNRCSLCTVSPWLPAIDYGLLVIKADSRSQVL